jgi:hypothetical protein
VHVQVCVRVPSHTVAICGGAATPCVQITQITGGSGPVLVQRHVGARPRGTMCRCAYVKCMPMNWAALATLVPGGDSAMAVASAVARHACASRETNQLEGWGTQTSWQQRKKRRLG